MNPRPCLPRSSWVPTAALFSVSAAALLLTGCSTTDRLWPGEQSRAAGPQAQVTLEPTRGNQATGQLRFAQLKDGRVRVTGSISGLAPNKEHGFHAHAVGDCSSGDGMSAGGHFNPDGSNHGRFGTTSHHSGDLPSLQANAQGVANVEFESTSLRLDDGTHSVVGKALIVHRDPDDYTTQPTGNSGPRLACGVVQAVK